MTLIKKRVAIKMDRYVNLANTVKAVNNQAIKPNRIEYIDAMRGFTMLLVVYSHVILFGYSGAYEDLILGGGNFLTYNELFVLFRMPLFFFISGFILFKKDFDWSLSTSWRFLLKKAKVQIIPTAFFMAVFVVIAKLSFTTALTASAKEGYWFTITLFEYFVLYVLFRLICKMIHKKDGSDILLLLFASAVFITSRPTFAALLHLPEDITGLLGMSKLNYFVYFAFGTLIKKHFARVEAIMDNGYVMAMLIIAFLSFIIASYLGGPLGNILKRGTGFLGVMIVFALFRYYQSTFSQEHRIGCLLQFIGRRTLDIYLLHYFFLPRNLDVLGKFFSSGNNYSIEFIVTLLIASLVIGLSLCVSGVLRTSPILAHWLFGAKKTYS